MAQKNASNAAATKERTLDSFKAMMTGGGARSNLFEIELDWPASTKLDTRGNFDLRTRMLVKAASLPASTISNIAIPFRGRQLKIAGDRTFEPWSITVINDTDFLIRTAFERWMNLMNKHEDNAGLTNPTAYQKDLVVRQLGRSNLQGKVPTSGVQIPVLKQYKFLGAYPVNVTEIALSYDTADAIETFDVEMAYQWYDILYPSGQSQIGTGA